MAIRMSKMPRQSVQQLWLTWLQSILNNLSHSEGFVHSPKGRMAMIRNLALSILLTFVSAAMGCGQHPGMDDYAAVSKAASQSRSDGERLFNSLPVNRQINAYLYSQIRIQGGNSEFLRLISSDGEARLPALLARLDADDTPLDKGMLLLAIDMIDEKCRCLSKVDSSYSVISRNDDIVRNNDHGNGSVTILYRSIRLRIDSRRPPNDHPR